VKANQRKKNLGNSLVCKSLIIFHPNEAVLDGRFNTVDFFFSNWIIYPNSENTT